MFTHFAEHLRLLDAVDPQIGFQIGVEIDHVFGIPGLFDDEVDQKLLKRGGINRGRPRPALLPGDAVTAGVEIELSLCAPSCRRRTFENGGRQGGAG